MEFAASFVVRASLFLLGSLVLNSSCKNNVMVASQPHPLDGLSSSEFEAIASIIAADGSVSETARFAQVALVEPPKADVKAFVFGDPIQRDALVYMLDGAEAIKVSVDITGEAVTSVEPAGGQVMILLEEFIKTTELVFDNPEMIAGFEARGLTPDQVYCLPLTAGTFGLDIEEGTRLLKVPCYKLPTGSNWFAQPVEGLFATVDLGTKTVIEVVDTGVVPIPQDPWGYTPDEIAERFGGLRGPGSSDDTSETVAPDDNISIDGSIVNWDIWRFHFRADKRPGLVLSQIDVNDQGKWRSVLYQAFLSEVFVPYMDPSEAWYFRTYMDSGEYGFGIFMSPLEPGIDCPKSSRFIDVTMHDDVGMPFDIPGAVCIFERSIGDPLWRHYELFEEREEFANHQGRPMTELVVRYASQVGNYDYLVDFIFQQDGTIRMAVGSTGIDATKAVQAKSMSDPTAAEDTKYGTLLSENLLAPFHSHFFNFRLDFDIDGQDNVFQKAMLVQKNNTEVNTPRKSFWVPEFATVDNEIDARTQFNPASPANFYFINPNVESALGHNPGYSIVPTGSYVYPLLSPDDPPAKRNAFIENQLWCTPHDPTELYAGGEYAFQSTGNDTLKEWTNAGRSIANTDIVAWYTVGFHHVTRTEDWPVMPIHWAQFKLMPFNFFDHNPAIDLAMASAGGNNPTECEEDPSDGSASRVLSSSIWSILSTAAVAMLFMIGWN